MFRLREILWATIREVMLHWGGGFAGISFNPPSALAGLLRGHGPLEGSEGEARFHALSDFEELCQEVFRDQSVPEAVIRDACSGAYRVLVDLEGWLSDHPQRM